MEMEKSEEVVFGECLATPCVAKVWKKGNKESKVSKKAEP